MHYFICSIAALLILALGPMAISNAQPSDDGTSASAQSAPAEASTGDPIGKTDEIDKAVEADLIKASKPAPFRSAKLALEKEIEEYALEQGIEFGTEMPNGKYYFKGVATSKYSVDDADWGKGRSATYMKAVLNAQKDFLSAIRISRLTAERLKKEFTDHSTNADAFPEGFSSADTFADPSLIADYLEKLAAKAIALSDVRIDKLLENEGISPEQIKRMTPEQKKTTFSETIINSTIKTAFGQISGLMPVQTFEGISDDGKAGIGVVLMYSPRLVILAKDIMAQRPSVFKGTPGVPLRDFLPKEDGALVDDFGVRCLFDPEGRPYLLSYGQWAISGQNSDGDSFDSNLEHAERQAESIADSELAFFMAGDMNLDSKASQGEDSEKFVTRAAEGLKQKSVDSIVDIYNESIRQRASIDLAGIQTNKTWYYKHPNGDHTIVGVVRVWTPDAQAVPFVRGAGQARKQVPQGRPTLRNAPRESSAAMNRLRI
jgi:hypothetical protein